MPPKRGSKAKQRKGGNPGTPTTNGDAAPSPPDRESWPGWVEMESEPAFFNVMLRELGVHGVRVQEIFSMDEQDLLLLPRPVHALIFLFRYAAGNDEGTGTDCPDHVWFANQLPDFACGTVSLLNVINNIPDLPTGPELRDFKETTQGMDPFLRGQTLDSFEFLRKVHNSFARESDMLNADMLLRDKVNKLKRKQAAAKARETKAANKATPLRPKSVNTLVTPSRSSLRSATTTNGTKKRPPPAVEDISSDISDPPDSDSDFPPRKKLKPSPAADEPDGTPTPGTRKSARKPQPRKKTLAEETTDATGAAGENEDNGAFHFIAYMPIQNEVYKLDGLDSFPEKIGTFDPSATGEDWMTLAEPIIRTRMALHEAGGIEFNLMAVVHDPVVDARRELAGNIKALRKLGEKLDGLFEDWRELNGGKTGADVITEPFSLEFGICEADVEAAELPASVKEEFVKEEDEDLLKLVELRAKIAKSQASLRGAVRDALAGAKNDEEEARHRRYDYGSFVKGWLGALAENELLSELLADE